MKFERQTNNCKQNFPENTRTHTGYRKHTQECKATHMEAHITNRNLRQMIKHLLSNENHNLLAFGGLRLCLHYI